MIILPIEKLTKKYKMARIEFKETCDTLVINSGRLNESVKWFNQLKEKLQIIDSDTSISCMPKEQKLFKYKLSELPKLYSENHPRAVKIGWQYIRRITGYLGEWEEQETRKFELETRRDEIAQTLSDLEAAFKAQGKTYPTDRQLGI